MRAPRPALLLIVAVLAACGASAREKALSATYAGLATAADGFIVFDKAAQAAIVAAAKTETDGIAQLAAYRAKRARVVDAFAAAFHLLAAASIADKGITIASVAEAAEQAIQAWNALKGAP